MDASEPPQVETPMAASSPQHVYTMQANYEDEEPYHHTTTGKPQHSLYPTLPVMHTQPQRFSQDDNAQVRKASADFQSYLQDEQEQFEKELNFCEAYSCSTNTSPSLGITQNISPQDLPEVYSKATGTTDMEVQKQSSNDNMPQSTTKDKWLMTILQQTSLQVIQKSPIQQSTTQQTR